MDGKDNIGGESTCERCSMCDGMLEEGAGRFRMPFGVYCMSCYLKLHPVMERGLSVLSVIRMGIPARPPELLMAADREANS